MINRRSFLVSSASSAALASRALQGVQSTSTEKAKDAPSALWFEFVTVRLQFGTQVGRLLEHIEKRALPLFQKHHFGPMGFFTVEVGPNIPAVFSIRTYTSLAEIEAAWGRLTADPAWAAAAAELESEGPAFYREDSMLLLGTQFSPAIRAAAPGDPTHKIFELRIYESPTFKQLGYLHDRFAGGEIDIFHKSGIHPVLYADTIIGPNRPNMAYLIPFESEAHRENSWAAFRDNADWRRLRDESVRRGGEIVRNITNMIFTPAAFSMMR